MWSHKACTVTQFFRCHSSRLWDCYIYSYDKPSKHYPRCFPAQISCVYLKLGKTRVTPQKAITIPRLELSAAVLAVKIDDMVKKELNIHLKESLLWTDSTAVLQYINHDDRCFHTFVANRVSTIRDLSEPTKWKHISTKENPADYVSRGLKVPDFLKTRTWLEGPEFLWKEKEKWSNHGLDVTLDVEDKEVRKEVAANTINTDILAPTDLLFEHFSD